MADDIGVRIEAAIAELLRRDTRENLYLGALAPYRDVLDAVRYPTLSGISRYEPISAAMLSRRLGVDRTVVSRYAAQLEDAGLVSRRADSADRRASLLSLTPRGREIIDDVHDKLTDAITETVSTWPKGLAAAFAEGLERLVIDARATGRESALGLMLLGSR